MAAMEAAHLDLGAQEFIQSRHFNTCALWPADRNTCSTAGSCKETNIYGKCINKRNAKASVHGNDSL